MKNLGYLIIFLFLSSCLNQENKTENEKQVENVIAENDSTKLNETSIKFFFWYKSNYDKLNALQLVNNADLKNLDSTKYYSVNFKNAATYLNEFKKSGFVSQNFIENEQKYFKECEKNFKENPQNDGPAEGLDYDRIVYSPEFIEDVITKETIKSKAIKIDKESAVVEVELNYQQKLILTYRKENGNWKIENIMPK